MISIAVVPRAKCQRLRFGNHASQLRKRGLGYGVQAVFYKNLWEQTGKTCCPRIPAGIIILIFLQTFSRGYTTQRKERAPQSAARRHGRRPAWWPPRPRRSYRLCKDCAHVRAVRTPASIIALLSRLNALIESICHRAHGVVVSHPLSMREALGSIPSVSIHGFTLVCWSMLSMTLLFLSRSTHMQMARIHAETQDRAGDFQIFNLTLSAARRSLSYRRMPRPGSNQGPTAPKT